MDLIDYRPGRRVLAVARGHPYDRNAFLSLFEGLEGYDVCLVEQPLAQQCFHPEIIRDYDAVVCYDMPGVDFAAQPGQATGQAPPEDFRKNFLAMLEAGKGVLFLHHALAAWPDWDEYAGIVGGRFHYVPAELRGRQWPDSGYRHRVSHTLTCVGDHPVTRGLPQAFEMTDELYLCPVFEDEVVPLLRSDYSFTDEHFYSASAAVAGQLESRAGWTHPPGSALVGWVNAHGSSPIVYLQGGDDAEALADRNYRQLVHNALDWLCSAEAGEWAAGAPAQACGNI